VKHRRITICETL